MTLWPTSCHKFAGYLGSLKQVIRVLPLLASHLPLALGGLEGLHNSMDLNLLCIKKDEKSVKSSFFKQILNPFEEIPTSTIGSSESLGVETDWFSKLRHRMAGELPLQQVPETKPQWNVVKRKSCLVGCATQPECLVYLYTYISRITLASGQLVLVAPWLQIQAASTSKICVELDHLPQEEVINV